MLRIDNKKKEIEIVGESDQLEDEIGTLMFAICGEVSKVSKGAAEDMFMSLAKSLAATAGYLEMRCGVKLNKLRQEVKKAEEDVKQEEDEILKALKELEDALKKKGDK